MSSPLLRRGLHLAVRMAQSLRRAWWFVTRPRTKGAHAAAITPAGEIVLVSLSYARGWRLPGGGVEAGESAREAVLRELEEEIGMIAHGAVETVGGFEQRSDYKRDCSTLFIVRDVVYEPRWSLEVKEVRAFPPSALPRDTAPITRRLLATANLI